MRSAPALARAPARIALYYHSIVPSRLDTIFSNCRIQNILDFTKTQVITKMTPAYPKDSESTKNELLLQIQQLQDYKVKPTYIT